jgi:hypothetical protein
MSRIPLTPKNKNHNVVVGLDRPLRTFFITVTHGHFEDLPPIEFRARWTRLEVIDKIKHYAADTELRQSVIDAIGLDLDPAEFIR